MKKRQILLAAAAALVVVLLFTWKNTGQQASNERKDKVTVVASAYDAREDFPDIENYRLERETLQQQNLNEPRIKPEFKGAPAFRASDLRSKVAPGPVDDYGAPMFVPSETAMADGKIFEQELAKHQERTDSYAAARMDELKLNTEAERIQMRGVIDQAKASGSKTPEEIKRAEDAYARMEILEKVLKGEKVEKILD
ncbi:hypothetical protein [Turneriella parva]|uniref:Uncharacterized protein n=1 Tax=Turneriella parva (strain ATCC BAA-1111 / DSM 21527 / NCTC 11395 / H) TaxID=869212 RepID=I4B8S2_TURPD|nr:hypothetical protein [Turneriella parva]AFM13679.1 hypothetical protein Turpa_3040 [Turneriella parva DSM 21527]